MPRFYLMNIKKSNLDAIILFQDTTPHPCPTQNGMATSGVGRIIIHTIRCCNSDLTHDSLFDLPCDYQNTVHMPSVVPILFLSLCFIILQTCSRNEYC